MGQTLTHGVYLPDEGERNCYSGLAANWQILDTSVGTIAEHTSALSGKAPLVHTHVKSDITDLFNSANTWSGSNSFTGTTKLLNDAPKLQFTNTNQTGNTAPSSNTLARIQFNGSTVDNFGNLFCEFLTTGENRFGHQIYDISKTKSNIIQQRANSTATATVFTCDSIIPATTGETELGTSSKKWKTLNGINPGALSLPDLDNTYRWSLDTTNWVLDGSSHNTFTLNFSGWLNIRIPDAVGNYIIIQSGSITISNQGTGTLSSAVTRPLSLLIPVIEGVSGTVRVNAASIVGFFYPALGNPIKTVQSSS